MKPKRQRILQAVMDLLAEKGPNRMKVSEIAKKADVGKGTVYEYFSSKDDLFIGAAEYGFDLFVNTITKRLNSLNTFQKSFDELVDCVFEAADNSPFISFMSDAPNMSFSPATIENLKKILSQTMQNLLVILSDILKMGAKEGLIKSSPTLYQKKAMLIIITNMTMHSIHLGDYNTIELKQFYYETCLRIFS